MALSEYQSLVLVILKEAIDSEELDLSIKDIGKRLADSVLSKKPFSDPFISKLISSVPDAIFPEDKETKNKSSRIAKKSGRWKRRENIVIQSFYLNGAKQYYISGKNFVTRKETAQVLLEVRRLTAKTGKVTVTEFLEKVKREKILSGADDDFIKERLFFGERQGYIGRLSETEIFPTEALFNILSYLYEITGGKKSSETVGKM